MELKVAIISDAHTNNQKIINQLVTRIKKEHVDAVILNGDLGENKTEIDFLMKATKRLNTIVFAQPGSHESIKDYKAAIKKNKHITDCSKKQKQTFKGYDLIFLPGSDWSTPKGQYKIVAKRNDKREKGNKYYYISDLKKVVKNPPKTILFCHIPPLFKTKNAIDRATFGQVTKTVPLNLLHIQYQLIQEMFRLGYFILEKGTVFPLQTAQILKELKYPVEIKNKNVGNKHVRQILQQVNIKFFVCGHIHESAKKAHTFNEKKLKPNTWSKELFLNAASIEDNNCSIIILNEDKIKYKNY